MFKFIKKTRKAFKKLKEVFIKTSILLHFDFKRRIRLKIDVFDFVISKIIFQLIEEIDQWHLITFFFRKMFATKRNYEIEKKKYLRWSNHVVFFDITWKKRYFRFRCWSITLIWTHSSKIKSWTEKNTMMKETQWFESLHRISIE
jgi:hypothetical protein